MIKTQQLHSVFDLAQSYESLQGSNAACLKRIFQITAKAATCKVGHELSAKYNVQQDNRQLVVSFTNRYTLEQTWFNKARTQKPQTFSQGSEFLDPTDNGTKCDFCKWQALTAQDPGFGRIELPHAVTGSNLFKYAEPSHGIVLFKHHNPLQFQQEQLSDLLDASWLWFQASHKLHPHARQPFFLWNCLPRAGASQYHGHAQVMLTEEPVPFMLRLKEAATVYQQEHSRDYYADVLRAHDAAGLLRQISIPARNFSSGSSSNLSGRHVAWGYASLSPYKDMEVTVMGSHICCPAFQHMLHAALRAIIDSCGCRTFNVGVLNMDIAATPPAGAGTNRQFWNSSVSSSSSSSVTLVEGSGGSGSSSSSTASLDAMSTSSSSSGSSTCNSSNTPSWQYSGSSTPGSGTVVVPDTWSWGDRPPIVARLVSRGKLSSIASDFGCLEVFGGASIGHTDPFVVVQALDDQLAGHCSLQQTEKGTVHGTYI